MFAFHLPIKCFTELLLATTFRPRTFQLMIFTFIQKKLCETCPYPPLPCHHNSNHILAILAWVLLYSVTFLLNLLQIFVCSMCKIMSRISSSNPVILTQKPCMPSTSRFWPISKFQLLLDYELQPIYWIFFRPTGEKEFHFEKRIRLQNYTPVPSMVKGGNGEENLWWPLKCQLHRLLLYWGGGNPPLNSCSVIKTGLQKGKR